MKKRENELQGKEYSILSSLLKTPSTDLFLHEAQQGIDVLRLRAQVFDKIIILASRIRKKIYQDERR